MRDRDEKLGLVVEESMNGGIVLWKVRKRSTVGEGESKGQSSVSHSLLPCEKKLYNAEGSNLGVKGQRRGRLIEESVNRGIVLWKVQKMQLPSTSHKALPQTLDTAVICRAAYAQP